MWGKRQVLREHQKSVVRRQGVTFSHADPENVQAGGKVTNPEDTRHHKKAATRVQERSPRLQSSILTAYIFCSARPTLVFASGASVD